MIEYRNEIGAESEIEMPPRMEMHPVEDLMDYFRDYAREEPYTVAMICFGIGFILGWKLKPW